MGASRASGLLPTFLFKLNTHSRPVLTSRTDTFSQCHVIHPPAPRLTSTARSSPRSCGRCTMKKSSWFLRLKFMGRWSSKGSYSASSPLSTTLPLRSVPAMKLAPVSSFSRYAKEPGSPYGVCTMPSTASGSSLLSHTSFFCFLFIHPGPTGRSTISAPPALTFITLTWSTCHGAHGPMELSLSTTTSSKSQTPSGDTSATSRAVKKSVSSCLRSNLSIVTPSRSAWSSLRLTTSPFGPLSVMKMLASVPAPRLYPV
mmetsp:Transcript_25199/g.86298  ORF Transcript_25199/g.86298 Transcript_25199/m.86298 type:complete len:257 (-) Transcript_25199:783-1553(-)